MLTITCHCGEVRVTTGKQPDFVNECNCSLCSASGARWAYFDPADATVQGKTSTYRRTDKDDPGAQMHFCPKCGSTTHFTLTEIAVARFGDTLMGVNMRLADEDDLAGIELRYPDGRTWTGEGDFTYVREARIFGRNFGPGGE